MNLAVLPYRRAGQESEGSALADDHSDAANTQLLDAVGRAAAKLSDAGVAGGDVVAVMLPNTVTLVVASFAAWRLGAAATLINPSLAPAEVDYQLADAGAKVLIVDDHANLSAMCRMIVNCLELSGADRNLLIPPLFHVNGIVIGTLSPLLTGGSASIAGRFSPKTFFDRLERSRATYFSAVSTIYTMLADLPPEVKPDTSAVRFAICGVTAANVGLLEEIRETLRHLAVGRLRFPDHVRSKLSKYKLPVDITILNELPKNPVGKSTSPDFASWCLRTTDEKSRIHRAH